MRALRYLSIITTIIWLLLGLMTLGGILLSKNGLLINLIFSIIFYAIGLFVFFKERELLNLLLKLSNLKNDRSYKKVIASELILVIGLMILGCILLVGAWSRIFHERLAIFG